MTGKLFGIGFHKTGTTSLAEALETLGYRVTGPNGVRDPDIEHNVDALTDRLVEQYDAFQDNPWPILYRELDAKYPGSKFILTLRDPDRWIRSQVQHFGSQETPMRRWIYGVGSPLGNEETYLQRFRMHNESVIEYFKDRPEDLLVLTLAEGDGWEKLCRFLDKPVPNRAFPHTNTAAGRERPVESNRGSSTGLGKRVIDRVRRRLRPR